MTSEMLTLRVSREQKAKLETLSQQRGCTVSEILRSFIDNTDKQNSVEIPPDSAETVALCAELQEQSIPEFVNEYFTDYLRSDTAGINQHGGYLAFRRVLLMKL